MIAILIDGSVIPASAVAHISIVGQSSDYTDVARSSDKLTRVQVGLCNGGRIPATNPASWERSRVYRQQLAEAFGFHIVGGDWSVSVPTD